LRSACFTKKNIGQRNQIDVQIIVYVDAKHILILFLLVAAGGLSRPSVLFGIGKKTTFAEKKQI